MTRCDYCQNKRNDCNPPYCNRFKPNEFLEPKEWEAEHGEKLGDNAAVWWHWRDPPIEGNKIYWHLTTLRQVKGDDLTKEILVVNGPYSPAPDYGIHR
jgi:hypothetical protein